MLFFKLKELFNQELCDDLLEDSEEDSSFYSPPPPPLNNGHDPAALEHQSIIPVDVFNGTSQAYTEEDSVLNGVTDTHYNHLGRSQLETLYYSKCNQMKQMEEQINAFQEESEKKVLLLLLLYLSSNTCLCTYTYRKIKTQSLLINTIWF